MLRIECTSPTATKVVYALTGGITAGGLPQLERLVRNALGVGKEVVLDLRAVTLVDPAGVRFLSRGLGRQVRVTWLPVGLEELLRLESEEGA